MNEVLLSSKKVGHCKFWKYFWVFADKKLVLCHRFFNQDLKFVIFWILIFSYFFVTEYSDIELIIIVIMDTEPFLWLCTISRVLFWVLAILKAFFHYHFLETLFNLPGIIVELRNESAMGHSIVSRNYNLKCRYILKLERLCFDIKFY